MRRITRLHAVWALAAVLAAVFVLLGSGLDLSYVIPARLTRLAAIVLGGVCIAVSAIVFQTLAGNRILTPAVMGYEAVYLLWQSLLVLALGMASLSVLGPQARFLLSLLLMLAYSWGMHRWLRQGGRGDLHRMLLLGLVLTLVIGSFTQFVQLRISPGEFSILQSLSQASFNKVRPVQLLWAAPLVALAGAVLLRTLPVLDVLSLGREPAISLGVDHARMLRRYLALVAVLVAVSTSLLGPTAFMGIFVAQIAYALAPSSRHRATLPMGCAVAITLFIAAQLLVEQVFNYRTTVGILVNLVCGAYFLVLVVRTRGGP